MRCHGVPVHFLRASMLFTANPSLCDAVACKAIAWECPAVAYLFTATPLRFCARQCLCHSHQCPCDAPRFRRLSAPRLALANPRNASAVVCSAFPLPWLAILRQCYASQSPCQSALTMPFLSKSFHCRRVVAPCRPLPCQYHAALFLRHVQACDASPFRGRASLCYSLAERVYSTPLPSVGSPCNSFAPRSKADAMQFRCG